MCHLDRSVAKWRDLQVCGGAPGKLQVSPLRLTEKL